MLTAVPVSFSMTELLMADALRVYSSVEQTVEGKITRRRWMYEVQSVYRSIETVRPTTEKRRRRCSVKRAVRNGTTSALHTTPTRAPNDMTIPTWCMIVSVSMCVCVRVRVCVCVCV